MAPPPEFGLASLQALNAGRYQSNGIGSDYTANAINSGYNAGSIQGGEFGSTQATQYMNPYMQNVTDITKREALRQADIQRQQDNANAQARGAFGGSRQAVVDMERERNLNQNLADIQMRGSAEAYQNAQQQFNTDRGARMQAEALNEQNRQQQGIMGLQAQNATEQARQQQAALGLQGQTANEAARLQAANLGLQSSVTLGNLGGQAQAADFARIGALERAGGLQQQQLQNSMNTAYEDFLRQQMWPREQLGFYSSLLRGTPVNPSQSTYQYQAPPSLYSQLGGIGLGLGSLGSILAKG